MRIAFPIRPPFYLRAPALSRPRAILAVCIATLMTGSAVQAQQNADLSNANEESPASSIATESLLAPIAAPKRSTEARPPIVAHFNLSGAILEKPQEDPFGFLAGQITDLKTLLKRLENARFDDRVAAVVITYDETLLGLAQLEELHRELLQFRAAKKDVFAMVDSTYMSLPSFALLSAATELTVDPLADFWITGLYSESLHIKGLLEKTGVSASFFQFENYKSAAELLTRNEPSAAARENLDWLLDGLYASLIERIADSRGVSPGKAREWVDQGIHRAPAALEAGMVDAAIAREMFLDALRERFDGNLRIDNQYGVEKKPAIDFSNPFAFFTLFSQMAGPRRRAAQDTIALIYAEGVILPGYGQSNPFGAAGGAYSGDVRHALETAAADPNVKALVLRIDSPGGSVLGSEIIHRALRDVGRNKPVVVSMGNVAASGGYYIACGADEIFANEMTITGSIGVVGGKLITKGLWDKLGVNWVPFPRGENADFFASNRHFTEAQRERFVAWMGDAYDLFKNHVVEGRGGRLTSSIDELAGGRVFTGKQALERGLVDRIGGLTETLARAAERAGVEQYAIRVIPQPRNPIEELFSLLAGETGDRPQDLNVTMSGPTISSGNSTRPRPGASKTSGAFPALPKRNSIAGALPMIVSTLEALDPVRARAFVSALERVDLLCHEGIAYLLPLEMTFHP